MAGHAELVKRHRLSTRLWHWVNFISVTVMLMSGLGIFNAHPRLYWGHYGANFDHAWLVLERFPDWATIPGHYSLAMSRRWHLAFALIFGFGLLLYLIWSLFSRHISRDLSIRRDEISPRHFWQDVKDHARLRFPKGEAALHYNFLQKLSYIGVIFILSPLLIFTGLTMSPGMNAAWPWLIDVFGGRQSARSLHFIAAALLLVFFVVHIVMVFLAGPFNEVRAMITGKYRVPEDRS